MKMQHYSGKIITLLTSLMVLAGCSNDDDFSILPPSFDGSRQLIDSITIGENLELYPKLLDNQNTSYQWTIDGKVVGTDSIYVFTPEERGNYDIVFTATNEVGKISETYNIHTWGAFENGFFMVNEGWFGHGTGTVSFYRYNTQTLEDSVFVKTNPGKNLEPATSTLEYGTIFNEKLYLVSKVGGPVIVANAYTLKEEKRIPAEGGNNWRAFVGIDDSKGLLSSGDGIYKLDLNTMQLNGQVSGISGQVGDIIKSGNYIFALSATEGVIVINTSTLEIETTIPGMALGFAITQDNKVWAAGGTKLVSIDATTLETSEVELGFEAYGSWGAWHPGSITANASNVYIAKNGSWSGGKEIYKYNGDITSLSKPFVTLPESKILYGAGIGFDKEKDVLVVNTVREGWGENFSKNNLYFYDTSGIQVNSTDFFGYYFPAVPVFH